MNTAKLKTYAPEARRAFIAAVSAQAAKLGITAKDVAPAQIQGDVMLIGGQALPASYDKPRKLLIERIESHGFDQTMEAIAYTWFNRFVAIRYMELHGYLEHGYRVLSHPEGGTHPEILNRAVDIGLPGLEREKAIELKLDGTKDEELYRLLLLAQCNALHEAMPFLFERIGDETELLLPANLLHTDSLIRQLVEQVDEALWGEIEIIGWLYQFYISEKKGQVIGKVVKSEDIPAATQLFTPNWIVKYMVQNSLGAQWLATYPQSPLKGQMEFYIEPAEQTPEVNEQLAQLQREWLEQKGLEQQRKGLGARGEGAETKEIESLVPGPYSLSPEHLTLIDPASGSGHILVEAYDLFKAIYLERGYRQRDVPELILTQNLFGLEICPRAAQLTGFALMMKGRADDRQLFERGIKLNVMALVDSEPGMRDEGLGVSHEWLIDNGFEQPLKLQTAVKQLATLFEHATTFGSLIQVPEELAKKLPALKQLSEATSQDLFVSEALKRLGPLVQQAEMLAAQYDAVVANPPYMGGKAMNPLVKKLAKDCFPDAKRDLFACFIERGYTLAKASGHNAMVTMQSWMFLSSYEQMRERMLREKTICAMVHMSNGVMGIAFGTAATVLRNAVVPGYVAEYSHASVDDLNAQRVPAEFPVQNDRLKSLAQNEFQKIPGSPVAYWVSERIRDTFLGAKISDLGKTRVGCQTSDNNRFLRLWHEVSKIKTCFTADTRDESSASGCKWFPYNKGGSYRKWYGNLEFVVNWEDDGREIFGYARDLYGSPTRTVKNGDYYFRPSVTWSKISSGIPSFRYQPSGAIFDVAGASVFFESVPIRDVLLSQLNSAVCLQQLAAISPTLNYETSHIASLPIVKPGVARIAGISAACAKAIAGTSADWDAYERSWDFQSLPLLRGEGGGERGEEGNSSLIPNPSTLEQSYQTWITQNRETIAEMKRLEEENNRLFIDAYGLADELTPDVPFAQITLTVNPAYRYGTKISEEDQWTRFREDSMTELVSYAIGCMMGRYSLDAPGLIYAHSGNEGFDASQYPTFPADDDGIVPLTDTEWFDDDAAHRLIEFISVAWDQSHLEANLTFLADNLSPKKAESSRDTIRRYLCDKFFKDHLQTYRKRPIYWLFSSGKAKAFQALVYLHRYNEGTLARMRSEYVIPLQGKMAARLDQLQRDIPAATSTSHQKRLTQEREKLAKQQVELLAFDEKLRHYADMRISLDLDDGVKVNYGKFGDLLAEVKAVHGKNPEAT